MYSCSSEFLNFILFFLLFLLLLLFFFRNFCCFLVQVHEPKVSSKSSESGFLLFFGSHRLACCHGPHLRCIIKGLPGLRRRIPALLGVGRRSLVATAEQAKPHRICPRGPLRISKHDEQVRRLEHNFRVWLQQYSFPIQGFAHQCQKQCRSRPHLLLQKCFNCISKSTGDQLFWTPHLLWARSIWPARVQVVRCQSCKDLYDSVAVI
mmetsp:Transcript_49993/g.88022  ORF Transcript_49993/g.88022 Transcript_49993/m.88022 type:complete len:207 (-) Transcript_49993:3392-4012(-)